MHLWKGGAQRRRTDIQWQILHVKVSWETDSPHCQQSSFYKRTFFLGWLPLDENVTRSGWMCTNDVWHHWIQAILSRLPKRGKKPQKNKPYNFSILKVGCCDLFNNKTRIERIDCQSVWNKCQLRFRITNSQCCKGVSWSY